MKSLPLVIPLFITAVAWGAGPEETVVLAAMKLSEQPNYSWTSTVTDDACTYDIDGKTSLPDGWTWMRMPVVKSIARRLGRDADTHLEALFRDSTRYVIRTEEGWRTLAELPSRHRDWQDDDEFWVVPVSSTGFASMGGASGLGARDPFSTDPFSSDPFSTDPFAAGGFPRLLLVAPRRPKEEVKPYSNAQFALARPHDELGIVVASCVDLKCEGDTATGTLSDMGARLLLVREGQNHIDPVAAAGVFKLHLGDGFVTKYILRLEGIVVAGKKRVHVRQSSTTTIKGVGRTKLEVPDEARDKAGQ